MKSYNWFTISVKIITEIIVTCLAILSIIAFSKTFHILLKPQWLQIFFLKWKELLISVINFTDIRVLVSEFKNQNLMAALAEPYLYSMKILFCVLILSVLIGICISVLVALLPVKIQKVVKNIAFFLESVPDVILIFSIQLMIIWIFKKSAILLVNPIGYMENIYTLPVVVTSILPAIMLFQMTLFGFDEEKKKPYVKFARSKGITRYKVLTSHVFRNVCLVVFANIQLLLWLIISNLLITEYIFNMKGLFSFMFKHLGSADVLAVCLLFIFIPFYFMDYLGRILSYKISGQGGGEHE
jgi:peptide/nickel transport system permease protein